MGVLRMDALQRKQQTHSHVTTAANAALHRGSECRRSKSAVLDRLASPTSTCLLQPDPLQPHLIKSNVLLQTDSVQIASQIAFSQPAAEVLAKDVHRVSVALPKKRA